MVLVAAAGFAGCGDVNSTVCAGQQDDSIACTVDICNEDSTAWAHIPDNSLCDPGQRCDPTAGCVAAGALTGHAYLYAKTDHSGITVSIDGVEGASTTTDAMGNWSLSAVPTGTYTVTFTKDKWITQSQAGVAVFPEAASSPDPVTLTHARVSTNSLRYDNYPYYNGYWYAPDAKHGLGRTYTQSQGLVYTSYDLENLSDPVPVYVDTNYQTLYGGVQQPVTTNTHVVYNVNNQTIWSRSYDGSPAVVLASAAANEQVYFTGTPGPYTIIQKNKYLPSYTQVSLYVVKTDGSVPLGAPFWTTPDAQHNLDFVVNNDTNAVFGLNDATPADAAGTIALRRVDLATGTVTNLNSGFATGNTYLYSRSPDGSYIMGYLYSPTANWYRAFLMPISGTTGPVLAPDYGAANGTKYSDLPNYPTWLADNSGVVYQSSTYTLATNQVGEGHLKVWLTAQPTATTLANYNTYNSWSVHNKVVTFRDNSTGALKVVTAHSTAPQTYTLDANSNTILQDFASNDTATTSSYLVWTRSINNGDGRRAQIFSVNMAQPLLAAPTVVQLGGTLANTCAYEATLSDYTYWQLCQDTGVLSGFTQSSATAGTQTTNVRPGLIALPDADRVAFRKDDGKLYSSPNTGTLTEVKLISAMWDTTTPLRAMGKWVIFQDTDGHYTRASNADGSGIDEPLAACTVSNTGYGYFINRSMTQFTLTPASCDNNWRSLQAQAPYLP